MEKKNFLPETISEYIFLCLVILTPTMSEEQLGRGA